MDYKDTLSILKKDLYTYMSKHPKRLKHIEGVASCMSTFSKIYDLNHEKAQIIAYLHDLTKHETITFHRSHLFKEHMTVFKNEPYYLHALSAAFIGKTRYQINDQSILDAVTYHCTGYKKLDIYGKLLIISDVCEPSRSFIDTKEIYDLACKDIDKAYERSIQIKYDAYMMHSTESHPWFDINEQ